ncbi:MAG: AbrB/MazE/SpoVT family DNA-binding domain-containing protein [Methylomonas sp.]
MPAQIRAELGIKEGDELLLTTVNGEIHITPKALALQNALELVRKHVSATPGLSNALIAERRLEAENDGPIEGSLGGYEDLTQFFNRRQQ